jgi:hypothetical protein
VAAAKRTALVALLPVLVGVPVAIVGGHTAAAAAPVPALVRAPRAWGRDVLQPGRPYSQPLQRRPGVHASAFQPAGATSTNWSGYFESGNFTSVSASWTVPAVQPANDLESAGTWIGIDGVQANTLIQTGTGENTAGGIVEYDAWYELLPQQSITIGGVAPGDSMQASIAESAPNSGSWTLAIEDLTSGQKFSTNLVYTTPGMSAEWIQEAPSDGQGNILTLADYGAVTFTALKANGSAPFAANMQPVSMVNAATGNTISQPGPFDPNADQFSIDYTGPAPNGGSTTTSSPTTTTAPPSTCPGSADHPAGGPVAAIAAMTGAGGCAGYWVVTPAGQVIPFGAAVGYGALPAAGHAPVIDIIATPSGHGYWVATSDGAVHPFGDAVGAGDMSGKHLNGSIIAMAATPSGKGYWLVGSDGGIFAFGDARFFGSTGAIKLNRPVVGIAPASGGAGYWLVASDGGVFAFGTAPFLGSMGAAHLNRPVVGMTADPAGRGYRMVAADGGIFSFGAPFYGSLGSVHLAADIETMAPSTDGNGYYLLDQLGGVYAFGDAPYLGRA